MLGLPSELKLPILHYIRDSIPSSSSSFQSDPEEYVEAGDAYVKLLRAVSLYSKEWTAVAQSELYRNLILADARRMEQLLRLLRVEEEFRTYAKTCTSVRLGGPGGLDCMEVQNELNEIAFHLPNLVEISCVRCTASLHTFENFPKLRTLNVLESTLSTRRMGVQLPITSLCIYNTTLLRGWDNTLFPFLVTLHISAYEGSIDRLLPKIKSLYTDYSLATSDRDLILHRTPLLNLLSLDIRDVNGLSLDSEACIKDRIIELRLLVGSSGSTNFSDLVDVIGASRALKKIVLDGSNLDRRTDSKRSPQPLLLKSLRPLCKKTQIELWQENFLINGKVDLNLG